MFSQMSSSLCCNPDVTHTPETKNAGCIRLHRAHKEHRASKDAWIDTKMHRCAKCLARCTIGTGPKTSSGFSSVLWSRIPPLRITPLPRRALLQVAALPLSPWFCLCSSSRMRFLHLGHEWGSDQETQPWSWEALRQPEALGWCWEPALPNWHEYEGESFYFCLPCSKWEPILPGTEPGMPQPGTMQSAYMVI